MNDLGMIAHGPSHLDHGPSLAAGHGPEMADPHPRPRRQALRRPRRRIIGQVPAVASVVKAMAAKGAQADSMAPRQPPDMGVEAPERTRDRVRRPARPRQNGQDLRVIGHAATKPQPWRDAHPARDAHTGRAWRVGSARVPAPAHRWRRPSASRRRRRSVRPLRRSIKLRVSGAPARFDGSRGGSARPKQGRAGARSPGRRRSGGCRRSPCHRAAGFAARPTGRRPRPRAGPKGSAAPSLRRRAPAPPLGAA